MLLLKLQFGQVNLWTLYLLILENVFYLSSKALSCVYQLCIFLPLQIISVTDSQVILTEKLSLA